jgi:hypothetical protein
MFQTFVPTTGSLAAMDFPMAQDGILYPPQAASLHHNG